MTSPLHETRMLQAAVCGTPLFHAETRRSEQQAAAKMPLPENVRRLLRKWRRSRGLERTYALSRICMRSHSPPFPKGVPERYLARLSMPKPPPLTESSPKAASTPPPSGAQQRGEPTEAAPSASRGLEAVLDPVPGAWFFTRRDGTFAYVSLGACAWLGYARAEVRNLRIFDIDPRVTPEYWERMWSTTRPPDSLTLRTRHRRKDGTLSPVEVRAVRVYIDGEDLAVSYSVDLKETEETRQALVATQAELQRLLDHVPDLIFRLRAAPAPRLSFVSPSSATLLGYTPDELLDSEAALRKVIHADDFVRFLALDGTGTLGTGERIRFLHRSGRVVWMELRTTPLAPAADGTSILEGVARDMTEAYEREQLQEQLHQAQKMEAVGQLAGGIAHDFNNLLQVIQGNTQLSCSMNDDPRIDVLLRGVLAAADRASALIRQLLAFSRRGTPEFEELELRQIVTSLHQMLERLMGDKVSLTWQPRCEEACVIGNAGQLEQLVVNLCINARDALPRGGLVALTLDRVSANDLPPSARTPALQRSHGYALLVIQDDGEGMSAEVQRRMYEPFFTTKGPDRGTGLGLSNVYAVVQAHQGLIDVSSSPGEGSTFRIFLPLIRGARYIATE
jgi:two-component system, cell cycle sensor histidine kinase and response regulator CckA